MSICRSGPCAGCDAISARSGKSWEVETKSVVEEIWLKCRKTPSPLSWAAYGASSNHRTVKTYATEAMNLRSRRNARWSTEFLLGGPMQRWSLLYLGW